MENLFLGYLFLDIIWNIDRMDKIYDKMRLIVGGDCCGFVGLGLWYIIFIFVYVDWL